MNYEQKPHEMQIHVDNEIMRLVQLSIELSLSQLTAHILAEHLI
jgi:hypothetical protein